jgi:hypothetical protein
MIILAFDDNGGCARVSRWASSLTTVKIALVVHRLSFAAAERDCRD